MEIDIDLVSEYVRAFKSISADDEEAAHYDADRLLLRFLAGVGLGEIAEAWEDVEERAGGFWYA